MQRDWLRWCVFAGVIVATMPALSAMSEQPPVTLQERARGAGRIVVATVAQTTARYERNRFGDELIVTEALLVVEEAIKGSSADVAMTLEGGTVSGITMRASDLPTVSRGDRAVFFLSISENGRFEPHLRGKGILKLDQENRVPGSSLTLDEIRRQARAAGQ